MISIAKDVRYTAVPRLAEAALVRMPAMARP